MLRRAERPDPHDSHGQVGDEAPSAAWRRCLADSRKTPGHADAALYAAKQSGKNRTSAFAQA